MADKKGKGISEAAIGLWVLILAMALGKKSPPPISQDGAGISIQIFDAATGLPVPRNSPAQVTEGQRVFGRFTVTNLSTKGGVAAPAELQIKIDGYVGGTSLVFTDVAGNLFAKSWVSPFLANEPLVWEPYFTIPLGTAGQSAAFTIAIWTPPLGLGQPISGAVDSEPLTIIAPLVYKASVVIQIV